MAQTSAYLECELSEATTRIIHSFEMEARNGPLTCRNRYHDRNLCTATTLAARTREAVRRSFQSPKDRFIYRETSAIIRTEPGPDDRRTKREMWDARLESDIFRTSVLFEFEFAMAAHS